MSADVRVTWEAGRLRLRFEKLDADQRAALAFDREIALTAGAGAGKTFTLAARYVTLLAELAARQADPHPRQVLVLTFTDKATQEMKERCYAMLLAVVDALRDPGGTLLAAGMPAVELAKQRVRWQRMRDSFDGAAIHTFHGFCARLVAEFPFETGIAPGTAVSADGDASGASLLAAAEIVDEALGRGGGEIDALLDLLGTRAALVDVVAGWVSRRLELGGAIARALVAPGGDGPVIAASPVSPAEAEQVVTEAIEPLADQVLAALDDVFTQPVTGLQDWIVGERPADAFGWLERYRAGLSALASGGKARSLTHPSVMGKRETFRGDYKAAKAQLSALQADASALDGRIAEAVLVPGRADVEVAERLRAVARLATDAIERHRAHARAASAIDFSEMIVAARRALGASPGMLAELRERHRYIMVDECQDTDAAQWEVVGRLARARADTPEDRLFFVGDPKQSIYGFRGGDVAVFNRAVAASPTPLRLRSNYRSLHELVAFANGCFHRSLGAPGPGRPAFEASYEPIIPGRTPRPGEGPLPAGTVTLALHAAGSRLKGADLAAAEARWVADHITRLGLDLVGRKPRTSPPIAILLRARTHMGAFLDALKQRGIDYVVVGGSGFWGRPEVIDLGNVLLALARGDRIALVGALRGPLLGLDDQELTDLAEAGELGTFGDVPLGAAWSPRVQAACARWRSWKELKEHASLADLVAAIRAEAGHAYACAFDAPSGEAERNVARLLDKADAWSASGRSLDDFAATLRQALRDEDRETEATMPVTTAPVAVLTVHAAKGLEWPLVYVPQLGASRGRGDSAVVIHGRDDQDWSLASKVLDPAATWREVSRTAAYERVARGKSLRDAAESRRLLYVACTRAQDHLVLVGVGGPSESGAETSWSHAIGGWAESLAEDPSWLLRETLGGADLAAAGTVERPGWAAPTEEDARRIVAIDDAGVLEVSASSLDLLRADPMRWRERVVLGVPETHVRESELRRDLAAARGTTIHALLEDEAIFDDECARARWAATAREAGIPEGAVADGWAAVAAQLAVVRASADVESILAAPGHAEVGFRMRRGRLAISGRIDRLCRDPVDGAWMVVDYKSEDPGSDPAATAGSHREQLLAYSVAASEVLAANGRGAVTRAAVLFTRTGTLVRLPAWTPGEVAEFEGWIGGVG